MKTARGLLTLGLCVLVGQQGWAQSRAWTGGAGAGNGHWTNNLNWTGGAPSNPAEETLTYDNTGTAVTGIVNTVGGGEWTVKGLSVNNTSGTHVLDLNEDRLTVTGTLSVASAAKTARLRVEGDGVLQLGSVDAPADLEVAWAGAVVAWGYLTFTGSNTRLDPVNLRNVRIGRSTGNEMDARGYLDLRDVDVVGGTLSMDTLMIGDGDGAGTKTQYGYIFVDETTGIETFRVNDSARVCYGLTKVNGYIGDPDQAGKLPPGLNLRFGTDNANRCLLSVGETRLYDVTGSIVASTNGAFTGWISSLTVGRNLRTLSYGTPRATGTLDLRNMTNCSFDATSLYVGVSIDSNTIHATGRMYLPRGTATIGTALLGDNGTGCEGLLELYGTDMVVTNSLTIKDKGILRVFVSEVGCGLELAEGATLSIPNAGKIDLQFAEAPARIGLNGHYGLRWKTASNAKYDLLDGYMQADKIVSTNNGTGRTIELYRHNGDLFIGIPPPPRGTVVFVR